ncbi:hypothetical protein ABH926_009649 [Catenulispora sp. GP43]|uniref:hypothetical protein n=1 Tax=Catenulispora sp. GP43 TaxID=3156263 RepID=UPI003518347A
MPAAGAASSAGDRETRRTPELARMLLRIVLRDPGRLPENLAIFSLTMLGPGVPAYITALRRQNPDADASQLERLIAQQGIRETAREGGFVGGPFIAFVPVAFVAALLAQIKMTLRMAAASGRDPQDPERAAELLVIMGVHGDVTHAAAALKALPAESDTVRKHSAVYSMVDVIRRMAKLLGLIAPAAVTPVSRLVHLGRWLVLGLALIVGMVVPLIWLPYLSMSYYRGTVELAERVSVFYSGPEKAIHLPRKASDAPGLAAAALRALGSLALIVGGFAVFLALDVTIAGHEWPALLSLAVLISSVTGLVWYLRRLRHRR